MVTFFGWEGDRTPGGKYWQYHWAGYLKSHLWAACTSGSAPGPTLSNEYGSTLPFLISELLRYDMFYRYHRVYLPPNSSYIAFTPQLHSLSIHWLVLTAAPTEGWPGWDDLLGCLDWDIFPTLGVEQGYLHYCRYWCITDIHCIEPIHEEMARLSWPMYTVSQKRCSRWPVFKSFIVLHTPEFHYFWVLHFTR